MADLSAILENIRKTKEIMINNIDKLLVRGEKLADLKDKTDAIEDEAKLFAEAAHELQTRVKSRYLALTFIIIGMSLGASYTIITGYGLPLIALGAGAGGFLGYSVNWLRDKITQALSPSNLFPSPLKRQRFSQRELPKSVEKAEIEPKHDFLNAYQLKRSDDPLEKPKQRNHRKLS